MFGFVFRSDLKVPDDVGFAHLFFPFLTHAFGVAVSFHPLPHILPFLPHPRIAHSSV